jgi:monoamine oxidase
MQPIYRSTGRTPLFAILKRALHLAQIANQKSTPPIDELIEIAHTQRWTRRRFLKTSVAGAAMTFIGSRLPSVAFARPDKVTAPKIVIIGAGIAGLNAAYTLKKAGIHAEIYEGNSRFGGRIYTIKDVLAPGLVSHLGGSFINTNHTEMLALAKEFNLELLDLWEDEELLEANYFGAQHYTEKQLAEALQPLVARMKIDFDSLDKTVSFENEGGATQLDNTSLAEYLEKIGATGWIRHYLEMICVTEFGLDADQQSCLNLLLTLSTQSEEVELFSGHDERYQVKGGAQRITDELVRRLDGQIHYSYFLEAIRSKANGFTLTFQGPSAVDIDADVVIMTIPFSVLRSVDMKIALPPFKKKAINELGYGTNSKVLAGFNKRIWRDQGYYGDVLTDESFQCAWDNSALQKGQVGGITFFPGGQAGVNVSHVGLSAMLSDLEKVFPGIMAEYNGKLAIWNWAKFYLSLGSYSCYKPGQWTSIAGAQIKPVGNLFFAGEHCSMEFYGFMNGGAQTGKQVAKRLIAAHIDFQKNQSHQT